MKKIVCLTICLAMLLSIAVVPASAAKADPIIYTTADDNYFETGNWATTDNPALQSLEGVPSRYLAYKGNAYWVPELAHGKYKVSVYRTVHSASQDNQIYEIVHHGKTDYAVVSFTSGEKGWVELGTFDFWGDGDDYIKTSRPDKLNTGKPLRMHAISFELVEEIKTPIPENKAATAPGKMPAVNLIVGESSGTEKVEDQRVSTVVKPEKKGDVMLIPAGDPFYYVASGTWGKTDSAKGYDDGLSHFTSTPKGKFTYTPFMPAGKYKVEIFMPIHANSHKDQQVTVQHADKTDTFTLDYTKGTSHWENLGTLEFYGNGNDFISAELPAKNEGVALRSSAVRFTLVELSSKEAPKGKVDPANRNADIEMDIPAYPIAYNGISVIIDNILQVYDQPAIVVNDRTLVPLRGIFEALGAKVYWNGENESVTAIKDDINIYLQIGNKTATKNGKEIALDVPAQVVNDRTLVPVRFVSEALGAKVDWDDKNQAVLIQTGEIGPENIFIPSIAFQDMGTWECKSDDGGLMGNNLFGKTDETGEYKPAKIKVNIKEEGDYQIFVHARDFSANQQGARYFDVEFNGVRVPKTFGQHGLDGYYWERVAPVHLKQGVLEIALHDTSTFYVRCDGVFITKDLTMKTPPNTTAAIKEVASIVGDSYNADVFFPQYAKVADKQATSVVSIQNENVKMEFYTVPTEMGNVVQKKTTVNGKVTADRDNAFGTLLMYAKDGAFNARSGQFPVYKATFNQSGTETTVSTSDVYKLGEPSWLIPDSVEVLDNNTALLTATNSYADAVYKIELLPGKLDAKITLTLKPKRDGKFSANLISGSESKEFTYAFMPFRFNGAVLPEEPYMVSEPYSTVPMALKTVLNDSGEAVTTGVALGAENIKLRWPKMENADFGMTLRGPEGGALPSITIPALSSVDSMMQAGDSFDITYYLVESPGEWYPVYERMALDVYQVTDYRKNYEGSLTGAILNTTRLAADDYSGWDANQKGYSNIEAENLVTQSNPLVFMSTYLLSEDKDFLERRTIPSLAFLLTRPGFHYNNGDIEGTATYGGVTPIGEICKNYGSSVYGGAYLMTQGLTSRLSEYGIENGLVNYDSYGSSPDFQHLIALYQYTGNTEYLEKAKKEADTFIREHIDAPRTTFFNEQMFIAINFYPQFFGLIDMYEVTGEKKYLDAAERGARHLLPTVWIYPAADESEMIHVSADYTREHHYGKDAQFWKLNVMERAGYPDKMANLTDETVPYWAVSRNGLSLEQTFTYTDHNSASGNMIMANWAPDLMRLAEYTGNPIYETYARNAIIGRHVTYSGYYYTDHFAYNRNVNYPYEGPDITGLYWHHMQPFLAMLQDFLFTQAWNWSDKAIDFPSFRNSGYAYFNNRMYGGLSGKFYDEDDMWLWLKDGLLTVDNIQLDWFGARKDGVAFFAFMNEDQAAQTATVTLDDTLQGYSGEATVYDAKGNKTPVTVTDGKFSITVPGRTIVSVKVVCENVKKPEYATVNMVEAAKGSQKALPLEGETDTGFVLQMTGEEYFAHIYITERLGQAEKMTLNYKIGDGEWQKADDTYAPFEFIIRVDDTAAEFTYYVEKVINGQTIKSSEKTLKALGQND